MQFFTRVLRMGLLMLCIVLSGGLVFAQERTVSGTVTADNEGLPGCNVYIQGTTVGTITDLDGKYTLQVPGPEAVLVFSSVGFKTQTITVGAQSVVNLTMEAEVTALNEIVVTGYSIDNKRESTGAISTIKPKDLTVVPSGNVEQQLQGRVPGVTVITNGQPGTSSQIRVRGYNSFGDNRPLYIVDGVPVDGIGFLNPDDIETTTVLKDAATASIYGARAANGVIVYTTRQGTKGAKKTTVTYDGLVGFTTPGKGPDMMMSQDFADWTWKMFDNTAMQAGVSPTYSHPQFGTGSTPHIPDYINVGGASGVDGPLDLNAEKAKYNVDPRVGAVYQVVAANKTGTNWYKEVTRTAPQTRNTIGISGGGDNSRFYFGFGQQHQDGIIQYQSFDRYTFRANSEFGLINNKVRIGENLQGTYTQTLGLIGGSGGSGSSDNEDDILLASRLAPLIPVHDVFGGWAGTAAKGFNNPSNVVANRWGQRNNRGPNVYGYGNMYVEIEPIPKLILRSSIGGQYSNNYYYYYNRLTYENAENSSAFQYGEGASYGAQYTFTNTINYKITAGLSNFDILLGEEALNTGAGRGIDGTGQNPFSWDPSYITLTTTGNRNVTSYYYKGSNYASYFGRLNYSFNDKYLASVVIRRDGSSAFGSENRYGTFPAASLGWRMSSEPFMQGVTFINDLKIRAGYGIMGNSRNVDPTNQYSLFATSVGTSNYDIGGTNGSGVQGFYRSRIGNPAAKWEKAITKDVGFDASIVNDKIQVSFDWWQKNTEDLLFQVPQSYENGPDATVPYQNVGKMLNRGIDLQIVGSGDINDLGYKITLNGSFLHNEILGLTPGLDYLTTVNPSYRGVNPVRNSIGHSMSSFYGYEVVGLFKSQAEIDAAATQDGVVKTENADADNPAQGVGRFHFKDINGDGVIDTNDRTYLGSPVPKFTGGLTVELDYHNFELDLYGYLSAGNKIWNQSKWFSYFYPSFAGAGINNRVKDSWTPENPNGDVPIFENVSNFSTNTQANSWYVENGSFFRFQSITLAYNFPQAMLDRMKMSKLRIYAQANNIFTITSYEGLDPMVGGAVDTTFGIDVGNYPLTRSFNLGVNIGF
jgi:TonB-linked SusC/RagA family outer membrane protein